MLTALPHLTASHPLSIPLLGTNLRDPRYSVAPFHMRVPMLSFLQQSGIGASLSYRHSTNSVTLVGKRQRFTF
jgi:hypothetical protein